MNESQHQTFIWDQALIEKYNYSGPRYTSYPTALEFNEQFSEHDFQRAAQRYPHKPLSLYIHLPFCHKLCYFCGCNKIVTKKYDKVTDYLTKLEIEIAHRAPWFTGRTVTQMHWGGGTPTYLEPVEISQLITMVKKTFQFADNAELSIELDPRDIEISTIDHLADEGFNRLSIGIQDFNQEVQRLVNRVQDEKFIEQLIERARYRQFKSINVDLIYGLPKQTASHFAATLAKVVSLSPDRLSIFNYAHLPSRFAAQRKIKDNDLPTAKEKLQLLAYTINYLTEQGYQYIGMDHFAKPSDELAVAQRHNVLHRNFQGYTTQGDTDLLGLGVSAISMLGDSYAQNEKDLKQYNTKIKQYHQALWKGLVMTKDDCIRRDVIKSLICNFSLDKRQIEKQYQLSFDLYFEEDLQLLIPFIADELVNINREMINVTAKGRLLIRNICMCFDRYLRQKARQQQFSRVI